VTNSPRVLLDARRAVRGLGIGTFVGRLMEGFDLAGEQPPVLWKAPGTWGPATVAGTLVRSGLFDLSPRLDPRTRRFDVVHYACNMGSAAPGPHSLLTVHDLMHRRSRRPRTRVMGALLELSISRAGRVVAGSTRARDEVEEAFPRLRGRIEVLSHGMRNLPRSTAPREHILAFGGASDPRKRTDLMVAAYRAYADATPNALPLVVLARAGLTPSQRTELEAAGATIVPSATAAEVDDLMGRAAAVLLTTREEGFGMPVLEAAEAATPVVLDAGAQIGEEVRGSHLILISGSGLGGWVAGMREAVERGPVPDALSLPGWDEVARRYSEIYRELAG
jgi:glycosyltransferase involved in cell wall biosynthesis